MSNSLQTTVKERFPPLSWDPDQRSLAVPGGLALLCSGKETLHCFITRLHFVGQYWEFTGVLKTSNRSKHHWTEASWVWPCLCLVNYMEVVWRLHSACQVWAALIMQLWSFILRLYTPTLTSLNASIMDFFFLPRCLCSLFFVFFCLFFLIAQGLLSHTGIPMMHCFLHEKKKKIRCLDN